ncbi:hypothetical protein [Streptomyces sp. x-80]|uniref:hypothetical protein n=1 Tax=Streptomyces sp. x-80 TaxID=2789282 RepID=UPI00398135A1
MNRIRTVLAALGLAAGLAAAPAAGAAPQHEERPAAAPSPHAPCTGKFHDDARLGPEWLPDKQQMPVGPLLKGYQRTGKLSPDASLKKYGEGPADTGSWKCPPNDGFGAHRERPRTGPHSPDFLFLRKAPGGAWETGAYERGTYQVITRHTSASAACARLLRLLTRGVPVRPRRRPVPGVLGAGNGGFDGAPPAARTGTDRTGPAKPGATTGGRGAPPPPPTAPRTPPMRPAARHGERYERTNDPVIRRHGVSP